MSNQRLNDVLNRKDWDKMPPVNILIKPASSACNMICKYCFYRDVTENRSNAFEGMLSMSQAEEIIRCGCEYAEKICSFTFQGGEPTLAGLDFFRQFVACAEKYKSKNLEIRFALQTNGLTIDAEWAKFFAQNHFLIGISLDGPADLHNANRQDRAEKGTWGRVMNSIKLFRKYRVDFNVLCVVTGRNARCAEKIYRFYRKNDFRWIQFIPCLSPIHDKGKKIPYQLSPREYGKFLIRLFDLWFDDLKNGNYISIRHFDNWMFLLLGESPEACNMTGRCSIQFVVEGDGSVYPCDFYVLDEWKMGNIKDCKFEEMKNGEIARRFVAESMKLPEDCKTCRWLALCRNGCKRERNIESNKMKTLYCESHKMFFESRFSQMNQAVQIILNRKHQTDGI